MGTGFQLDETKVPTVTTGASEKKYPAILMALRDNVVTLDAEGRIQYINHVSPGLDERQVLGSNWLTWLEETDRPIAMRAIEHTRTTGETTEIEFRAIGPQREMTWFQVSFTRLVLDATPSIVLIAQDITERKHIENKNHQITRLYATLSQINQTIVRVKEPAELYRAICQIAVQYGEFVLAWIGLLNRATGRVTPVACAGENVDYVKDLDINLNDLATGYGPTGMAIRTGKIKTSDDIQTDIAMQSWRDHTLVRDFRTSVSVPVRLKGETIGALNLYVHEPFFFSAPDEMHLLEEISLDISFALDAMQGEAERQRAAEALRESEARYRLISENAADVIWVLDPIAGKFTYVSPSVEKLRGFTPAQVMAQPVSESLTPASLKFISDFLAENLPPFIAKGSGTVSFVMEVDQPRKDGSIVQTEVTTTYMFNERGQVEIVGVSRDITERKRIENELWKSRERYQNFVQQSYEAIYCTEFDEPIDTTLPIEEQIDAIYRNAYMGECNQAMAAMYGLPSPDAFVGQRMIDAHGGKDNPVNRATFRQFIEGNYRALNVETEEITPEGERRWFISNNMGVVENGRLLRIWGMSLDITDRKRAEAVLHESEEKFRLFVEHAPAAMAMLDRDLNYLAVSRRWMQGYRLTGDIVGRNHYEVFPEIPERWKIVHRRCLAGAIERAEEDRFDRADGSVYWVKWEIHPWFDRTGNIGGIVIFSEDITERKYAEQSLRDSEERLELVMEGSQLGYWDWNIETGQVHRNARWAEMLGYTLEEIELSVKQWTDLHHPDDRARAWQSVQDHLEGRAPAHRCEYRMLAKDGQYKWILDQARVVKRDANGKPLRMSGTHTDITERKRAEDSLRENEASLRESQRVAHIGHWSWDTQTNRVIWSDEMKRIFGLDPATFDGDLAQIIARAIHPEDRAQVDAANQAVLTVQKPAPIEYRVILPDQSVHTIWAVPGDKITNVGGKIVKLTGIVQDITERKQTEERIHRQVQQLDALRSIDTAISSNFSLSITLDILLKQVVSQLGVDAAAVLLFNPNLLVLEFAAGTGFRSPAIQQTKVRLSEGIAGRTAFERRMQNATLISNTARDFANRPGITDENFNTYFGVPLIAKGQIKGVLEVFHRAPLQANAEWLNFLEILSGQAAIAIDNVQLFERLQRSNLDLALAYDATIEGWSRALDLRDKETEGHTQRVVELTLTMARVLGIAEADLVHLRRGALLHDIGKLGVPDAILFKPGKLSDEEMQIMRRHPVFAYEMLSPIAYLRPALDIPYCHHEKWDGTGYPRRLAGEQIPLAARIFAVVDVWDALCSDRPYRKGWDENQVREHIHSEIGTHFDPRVVEVFEKLIMLKHRSSCESIQ